MTSRDSDIRHDWTLEEIRALYETPLLDLVFQAQLMHRKYHEANHVQLSTLLNVKSGGCGEDCGYCSQSTHHQTAVTPEPLLEKKKVLEAARQAKANGSSRFCMGAAWRTPPSESKFAAVLEMIKEVRALGLETCVTLGMLTDEQSARLKEAGLDYYNHNLDTSPEYYNKIVSTRSYSDRLETLARVRKSGISICTGGIIGLGEDKSDVCSLIRQLSALDPHPESVPINMLVPISGTPLGDQPAVDPIDLVRTVATARMVLPRSNVRLSAGRTQLTPEAHALAFLAGANSIFAGSQLLTTPNPGEDHDALLLKKLGINIAQAPATA